MKNYFLLTITACCAMVGAAGCDSGGGESGFPAIPVRSAYTLDLPAVPPVWASLLGTPAWRVEWVNSGGEKAELIVQNSKKAEVSPPETWAAPVIAWPFWPERGINPGVFKPAGAIVPFDVSGDTLNLSWQGGVEACFYWELAKAAFVDSSSASIRAVPRLPRLFNWPQFRELFSDESLNAQIRADPWLADWPSIAVKTVSSGFDKRRLVPVPRKNTRVSAGPGPWSGTSPFAEPLLFESEPVFPAGERVDTWISAQGLLRCNEKAWILLPWDNK